MALCRDQAGIRRVIRLAARAALLLTVPACAGAEALPQLARFYEINQMEMGGGLELRPDGRFLYGLE